MPDINDAPFATRKLLAAEVAALIKCSHPQAHGLLHAVKPAWRETKDGPTLTRRGEEAIRHYWQRHATTISRYADV